MHTLFQFYSPPDVDDRVDREKEKIFKASYVWVQSVFRLKITAGLETSAAMSIE